MSEGYMALLVSILKNVPTEKAFRMLNGDKRKNKKWSTEDLAQIHTMRQNGFKWDYIGAMYGVTASNACKVYSYYIKKLEKETQIC